MTKKILHKIRIVVPFLIMVLGLIGLWLLIRVGYSYEWTGFGASTSPIKPNEEVYPAKTLWDWLSLLIIPTILAFSAFFFSRAERRNDQEIAEKRTEKDREIADNTAQDLALQAYLEQMSTLLLDKALRQSEDGSEVRHIARAWTLTFLRRLNGERKGVLLRFLYESGLINKSAAIISLKQADLSNSILAFAYLAHADLTDADMHNADMHGVNLDSAQVIGVNLVNANLEGATLEEADLAGTDMRGANLKGANLAVALIGGANLEGAKLEGAKLEGANLTWVDPTWVNLRNATYNKETQWIDDFDPKKHGVILTKDNL